MDLWYRLNRFLSDHLTPAVRLIFLINVGFFLLFQILLLFIPNLGDWALYALAEIPVLSIFRLNLWRFVTYMFLHLAGLHLLFNMMVLWFFAPDLESRWGTPRFWRFYLITGAGAGVIHAIISLATGREAGPMLGASGALYGVLLAYAAYYPSRVVLVWGILPIQIRYLVGFIVLFSLFALGRQSDQGVSHITHLAGLVVAYFYLSRYHHTPDIRRWRYMN